MNKKDIMDSLLEFNNDEITFKKLYIKKKTNEIATGDGFPKIFEDDYWFELKKRDAILVLKHNRYNPPFIHSHDYFEGIFVVKGNGICSFYENNGKVDIHLKANDYIILPPGKKHSLSVFNDDSIFLNLLIRKKTFRVAFFDFIGTTNILNEFFVNCLFGNAAEGYILFHTANFPNICDTILNIYQEIASPDIYTDFLVNQLTKEFFVHLMRLPESQISRPSANSDSNFVRTDMIKFISENFKNVSLTDVAEHFHFSVPYTSKMIKVKTGKTFNSILREIRMEHAKKLLASTNMKIGEIAEAIGYLNVEHFIKAFKTEFKITPSKYRSLSKINI